MLRIRTNKNETNIVFETDMYEFFSFWQIIPFLFLIRAPTPW